MSEHGLVMIIGDTPSKAVEEAVIAATNEVLVILSKLDPDGAASVICSSIMEFCCAQDDPVAVLDIIGSAVRYAIGFVTDKPRGRG